MVIGFLNLEFNPSSNTMSDYYFLKEKFKSLETQIEKLEKITSSKFFPYICDSNNLDLQFYILKNNLKFIRQLVEQYSRKYLIETYFSFRLEQCEQKIDAIFSKIQNVLFSQISHI